MSATEYDASGAWKRRLSYNNSQVNRYNGYKTSGFSVRCVRSFPSVILPTVSTTTISNIGGTTATGGGAISSDGGDSITARGVCWSISQNPTTSDSHTTDGTGSGFFTSSITGLDTNITYYYIRAYATNSVGTAYGNEICFTSIAVIPTLTTTTISNIAGTTATSGGDITNDGGATITARGVCWSTSSTPDITDSHTTDGTGAGIFTSSISGLTANTTYYVRAYATNSVGTSYGNEISFSLIMNIPCPGLPNFTDVRDGQVYSTVQIGTQCWMAQNLNVGTMINSTGGGQLQTVNAVIEKYCYNNISDSCNTYGGLYEWGEMMQYAPSDEGSPGTRQGICPTGWHLPTDAEWSTLTTYLGGTGVAGGKMKETGTTHWYSPNTGATNESGFTALPAGRRNEFGGSFDDLGYRGYFWSATGGLNNADYRYLRNNVADVYWGSPFKNNGFAVRCIKNI